LHSWPEHWSSPVHSQCPASDVCLPSGACGDPAQVAYVSPTGSDNSTCTKALPCLEVLKALEINRPFIKLTGTTNEQVTIVDQNVTLLADPGARLTDTSNGVLLRIDGTSQVSIHDLQITGASGSQSPGISLPPGNTASLSLTRVKVDNNQGGGISSSGGTLTVSGSTIASNTGGGISVMSSTFAIVGNVFFNNGSQSGALGGVSITTTQNAGNRLEFNSFNKNQTQDGLGSAIHCVAGTFTAKNNVMSGNGTLTNMEQVGGTCAHAYSIVRPGPIPNGSGNSGGDPLFMNTTTGDLHLMATSPARGIADPSSNLTGVAAFDIDGDPRAHPADIGADEAP
jgi:Right handed beta helix region